MSVMPMVWVLGIYNKKHILCFPWESDWIETRQKQDYQAPKAILGLDTSLMKGPRLGGRKVLRRIVLCEVNIG